MQGINLLLLRTGEMVLAGVGIGLGSQFSRPCRQRSRWHLEKNATQWQLTSTSIMQGTKIVRVRKVSTSTEVTKKNASWFIAGSPARKSPPKAIAMTSPAAEMIHLRTTFAQIFAQHHRKRICSRGKWAARTRSSRGPESPRIARRSRARGTPVHNTHVCLQQDRTRRPAELRRTATREMMKTS